MKLAVAVLAFMAGCLIIRTDGLAVMSVDLGSQFMKIAIVKPGVPMEIALNKESRRKTPVVVAFKDGERTFGDPALSVAVRYPKAAFQFFLDLVGKTTQNPWVKYYQSMFPYYKMEEHPETKMPVYVHDDGTKFTVEELLGMVLEKAKEIASDFAEQPVTEAVITVPPFFNQAERRAMVRAGELAGLKVLQLMNDNTAVALNYGIFRRKEFNGTAQHYMFFDMGSHSTSATVVEYKVVKQKNPVTGITDTTPQVTIKGVGFDRTLGGSQFQYLLRDHLANLFNKQKKTKNDVKENNRAMAKLFKEAGRVMQVLSANNEHYAQIEGLLDDQDFRAKVTRTEFVTMCEGLFNRVAKPVKDALKSSEVTLAEIKELILMGGGTRIPKVQELLMKTIGRQELGKSVNTDEAAALGAVYQAAHLSKGFRVKPFTIREATIYPIQVEFEKTKTNEDGTETTKMVKRTLFGRNNRYPVKKVMTFNKQNKDFEFEINYGDLDFLNLEEQMVHGNINLQTVTMKGVEDANTKHAADSEPKGVKAHFRMDDSGILWLDHVESVFEKPPAPEGEAKEEESTLSKIRNTFSNLFGDGTKEGEEGKDEKGAEKTEGSTDEQKGSEEKAPESQKEAGQSSEGKVDGEGEAKKEPEPVKEEKKPEEEKKQEQKEEEAKGTSEEKTEEKKEEAKEEKNEETKEEQKKEDKKDSEEKKGDKEEKKEEKKEPKEAKPVIVKEPLAAEVKTVDITDPSAETSKQAKKMITDLRKKDEEKQRLEMIKNELETFIFDGQDKLYQEDYEKCSTEEQRAELQKMMSEASDWLYEQEEGTERKVYEDKLKDLKKAMKALNERVAELRERPKAQAALVNMVNYSEGFLETMKNFTGEDLPFTDTEYKTLEKLIKETKEWNETMTAEQAKTPDTDKPKMTIEDIAKKISDLDREVKYLLNKAKLFKPKKKEEEKPEENSTKTEENKKDKDSKDTDDKPKENSKKEDSNGDKKEESKSTEDSQSEKSEEGIKIDLPPHPDEVKKEKSKSKSETEEKTEETLQLDNEGSKAQAEDPKKDNHHTPDDEL